MYAARKHALELAGVYVDSEDVVELDVDPPGLHVRFRRPRLELMPQRVVPAEIAKIHSG